MDKNTLKSIFDKICAKLHNEGIGNMDVAYIDYDDSGDSFAMKPVFITFKDRDLLEYFKLAFPPELFEARPAASNPSADPNLMATQLYIKVKDYYLQWRKQRLAGAPLDGLCQDPLRARVEAAGLSPKPTDAGGYAAKDVALTAAAKKLRANGAYGGKAFGGGCAAPCGDPLRGRMGRADNTVACCDSPDQGLTSNADSSIKVYYHDRFPSIPVKAIVDGAIELLNEKKNLHMTEIFFQTEKFGDHEVSLAFTADHPTDPGLRKVLEVVFTQKTFDRAHNTDIDKYAKLKARLDTNTFIELRIAYLLYQALKLSDGDARRISLDIFRISSSRTRRDFGI